MIDKQLEEEVEREKLAFRSELRKFVEGRTKELADRVSSGEDPDKLWDDLVEPVGTIVWLPYELGQITEEEAEDFRTKMTSTCPKLAERFLKEWQEGFGTLEQPAKK